MYLKILLIFAKTLIYYLRTFFPKAPIMRLKQQWAAEVMRDFGYRTQIAGRPPSQSPLILVGNHISFLDIMLLMSAQPDVVFIAKNEVAGWPIIGVAAARVGTIFIDRAATGSRPNQRKRIALALKENRTQVAVFPSGTTSLDESKPWKKGIFEIAFENSIPVKSFKISYSPLRESAYIDDDNLLASMKKIFSLKDKTASLTWLEQYQIHSPQEDAEKIRMALTRL